VVAAAVLVGAALVVVTLSTSAGVTVRGYSVTSTYSGPSSVSVLVVPIGLRSTGATSGLFSLPQAVPARDNLTLFWQVDCGGNASYTCAVTSVQVNAPFQLSYEPTGSNSPWVWSGLHGGDSAMESIYVTGPAAPGSYDLDVTLSIEETGPG